MFISKKCVFTANLRRTTTSNSSLGSIINAQCGNHPLILYYLIKYSIMGQNTVVVAKAPPGVAGPGKGCGEPGQLIAKA